METPKQASDLLKKQSAKSAAEAIRTAGEDFSEAGNVEALGSVDDDALNKGDYKHLTAAQKKMLAVPVSPDSDSEDDDDECWECAEGGDLVVCDGCSHSYHPECVAVADGEPALTLETLPDGDWFCPNCARTETISPGMQPAVNQVDAIGEASQCRQDSMAGQLNPVQNTDDDANLDID